MLPFCWQHKRNLKGGTMYRRIIFFAFGIFLLSGCIKGPTGPQGPQGISVHDSTKVIFHDSTKVYIYDTLYMSSNWTKVLDSVSLRSYMIGFRNEATGELILLGSGSAISQYQILTNAHVFEGLINQYILYKQAGFNITPVAVQNGSSAFGNGVYILDAGGEHNDYSDTTVFTYDVGYFITNKPIPKYFTLPPNDTIRKIKVGQDIGTIGFPGETSERLSQLVISTFKDGIISALVPFNSSVTPTSSNTYVVQYNFNNTPGTSGSPIFDISSRLIAVHNSGAVQNVWNDATGSFTAIPVGSIGYGIRSDVVNDMFTKNNIYRDTLSRQYIPNMFMYYPGSRICLKDGTKPVYLGTTMAVAKAAADKLFNSNVGEDSTAFQLLSDGSLYYTDSCSYVAMIIKQSATLDNVWAILIEGVTGQYSKYYLPSFRDYWGITIGTSRDYILNTYGSSYKNTYSIDSTIYYYTYSTSGIAFGFNRLDGDWNCDVIQIAQSGLMKRRVDFEMNIYTPNIPMESSPKFLKKKGLNPIEKVFK
jgi:V8-like Glu-specific endopeptidase